MTKPLSQQIPVFGRRFSVATILIAVILTIYWITLFYGTHTKLPPGFLPGHSDKVIHFFSYGVLGLLVMGLRASRGPFSWGSVLRRWLLVTGYGAFDEVTQLLVNRSADIRDWFADVVGATIGIGLVLVAAWCFQHTASPDDEDSTATAVTS